jgi:hypothetical protein
LEAAGRDARVVRTRRLRTATGIPSAAAARAREQRREAAAALVVRAAARRIRRERTAHGTHSAAAVAPEGTQQAPRASEAAPHRTDLAQPRGRSPAVRLRAAPAAPARGALGRLRADSAPPARHSPDAAGRALRSGRASMEAARSVMPHSRAAADSIVAVSVGIADSAAGVVGSEDLAGATGAGAAVSVGDLVLAGV